MQRKKGRLKKIQVSKTFKKNFLCQFFLNHVFFGYVFLLYCILNDSLWLFVVNSLM